MLYFNETRLSLFKTFCPFSGHPVPDCDVDNLADMKLGDVSVLAFFLGHPENLVDMVTNLF
jgi:hypothetical protein